MPTVGGSGGPVIKSAAEQWGEWFADDPRRFIGRTKSQVAAEYGMSVQMVTQGLRAAGEILSARGEPMLELCRAMGYQAGTTTDPVALLASQQQGWQATRSYQGRMLRNMIAVKPGAVRAAADFQAALDNLMAELAR